MTDKEVAATVAIIKGYAEKEDDESAHCEEDKLYSALMTYIANSCWDLTEAKTLLSAALKTRDFDFSRWTG